MAGRKGRSGGRNAKTVGRHKREGTYDASRHAHKQHPTPNVGAPKAPGTLTGAALKEWKRMIALLKGSEMLTVVDGAMLYNYCELHGDAEGLKADLRRLRARLHARLTTGELLEVQQLVNKLVVGLRSHRQAIRMYLVEFGLSPAARSRVDVSAAGAGAANEDDFSEFDDPEPLKLVKGNKG